MRFKALYLLFFVLLASQVAAYTVVNDLVYTNTSKVYLGASPHTLTRDGWVEIGLISKVLSGDVDLAVGFNSSDTVPSQPRFWKLNVSSGNNTYYWKALKVDSVVNRDFDGKNVWYVVKNVSVVANQLYKLKFYVDINGSGKYDVAVKPSADTIQSAVQNNRFLFLDPWYNETESLVNTNCTSNDWTNLDNGSSTVGYDTSGNMRLGLLYESSIVSSWFFENNANDEKCVNDGTLVNVTYASNGKIGGAYNFTDGIDSRIALPNPITTGESVVDLTITAWIYPRATDSNAIFCQRDVKTAGNWFFWIYTGKLRFYQWDTSVDTGLDYAISTLSIPTNQWVFVAAVFNASSNEVVYVINSTSETHSLISNTAATVCGYTIGGSPNGIGLEFDGFMDEIQVFNRTLTSVEISSIYNSGVGKRYNTSGKDFYGEVNETGSDINWFVPTINLTNNTFTVNATVCTDNRGNCVGFTEANNSENISISQGDNVSFSFSLGGNATSSPLIHNWGMLSGLVAAASNTAPTANPYITPTTAYYNDTLTCNGNGTDADNDTITYHYQWYKDGAANDSTQNVTGLTKNEAWLCQATPDDGTVNGTSVNTTTITISNTAPVIQTVPDQTIYHSDDLNIQINCSDADNDGLTYYDNSTLFNVNATGYITDNPTIIDVGVRSVNVTCGDSTINSSTTFQYTINNNYPTVNITTSNNTNVSGTLNVSFNTADADGDRLNVTIALHNTDGSLNETLTTTLNENDTWYLYTPGNITANYDLYVTANDTLNSGNDSIRINIDAVNPVVNITSHNDSYQSNTPLITINYTAIDANLDSCWYSLDGLNDTVTCNSAFQIVINPTQVHTLTVYANDTHGNVGSDTITHLTYKNPSGGAGTPLITHTEDAQPSEALKQTNYGLLEYLRSYGFNDSDIKTLFEGAGLTPSNTLYAMDLFFEKIRVALTKNKYSYYKDKLNERQKELYTCLKNTDEICAYKTNFEIDKLVEKINLYAEGSDPEQLIIVNTYKNIDLLIMIKNSNDSFNDALIVNLKHLRSIDRYP